MLTGFFVDRFQEIKQFVFDYPLHLEVIVVVIEDSVEPIGGC